MQAAAKHAKHWRPPRELDELCFADEGIVRSHGHTTEFKISDLATRSDEALTARLIAHAVASIEAAEHSSAPYPHIFFRDFFPADFYNSTVRNWPTQYYDLISRDGSRISFKLYGDNVENVDPELRDGWRAIARMLASPELERAIRVRLRDGLEIRARGDRVAGPDALKLVARPVLYRDTDGYRVRPHPDTRKKVVTMQIYCPADASQEELGTTLYRASLRGLVRAGSYFLEPVKTVPFLPNVGYAFVVLKAYHSLSRMSWHGRPKISVPPSRPRLSILNTFYTD